MGTTIERFIHLHSERTHTPSARFYPVANTSTTLMPQDVIAARCTMVNNRDRRTWIGATNNDEMCNFYVMYWVYGKQQVHPDICFSAGPPEWSWHKSAGLRNIPE